MSGNDISDAYTIEKLKKNPQITVESPGLIKSSHLPDLPDSNLSDATKTLDVQLDAEDLDSSLPPYTNMTNNLIHRVSMRKKSLTLSDSPLKKENLVILSECDQDAEPSKESVTKMITTTQNNCSIIGPVATNSAKVESPAIRTYSPSVSTKICPPSQTTTIHIRTQSNQASPTKQLSLSNSVQGSHVASTVEVSPKKNESLSVNNRLESLKSGNDKELFDELSAGTSVKVNKNLTCSMVTPNISKSNDTQKKISNNSPGTVSSLSGMCASTSPVPNSQDSNSAGSSEEYEL